MISSQISLNKKHIDSQNGLTYSWHKVHNNSSS